MRQRPGDAPNEASAAALDAISFFFFSRRNQGVKSSGSLRQVGLGGTQAQGGRRMVGGTDAGGAGAERLR